MSQIGPGGILIPRGGAPQQATPKPPSKRFELKIHEIVPEQLEPNGDRWTIEVINLDEKIELGQIIVVTQDPNINPRDPSADPRVEQRGVIAGIIIRGGDGHLLGIPDWALLNDKGDVVRVPANVPMRYRPGNVVFVDRNAKGRAYRILGREIREVNNIDVLARLTEIDGMPITLVRDGDTWKQEWRVAQVADLLEAKLPDPPIVLTMGPLLGLGDHGICTTLPERFAKLGFDVYLDSEMEASNPEILQLLWERNPYIKGLSDRKPNAGYVPMRWGLFYEIANRLPGHRSIEAMERAHGLPGPYSMAPKIYYEPKAPKIDVSNTVLVDYSAVSSKITRADVDEELRMMSGRFRNPNYLQLLHRPWVVVNQEQLASSTYLCSSIFEYMDFLHACKAWVGSEAGAQMLAAAVRGEHPVEEDGVRPEIVCKITPQTHNSRGYTFRGVDYRETGDGLGHAYWLPGEVKTYQYYISCKIRGMEMSQRLAANG